MAMPVRLVALALLAAVISSSPSLAQTVAKTASNWGLLGTWRTECSGPASQSNFLISYVARGGVVYQDRNWGDGSDSNRMTSASIKPDGSLEVVIAYASYALQITWVRDGNRKRAVNTLVVGTGDYRVRDGKFTSNGNVTPWQSRCPS